uniref:Conotoxin n=1 Tax=Conus andremenezi TaxID=1077466 RepID=A0A291C1W1_9COND|nr:conotoxin [Conus andremenezi]
MFGHTSVNFHLLSIMVFGMVATVICSCGKSVSSENCEQPGEEICSCSNHVCCPLNAPHSDQCMTLTACSIMLSGFGRRRTIQMQERFLRMTRGLAD